MKIHMKGEPTCEEEWSIPKVAAAPRSTIFDGLDDFFCGGAALEVLLRVRVVDGRLNLGLLSSSWYSLAGSTGSSTSSPLEGKGWQYEWR